MGAVAAHHFENLAVLSEVLCEVEKCLSVLTQLKCSLEPAGDEGGVMLPLFAALLSWWKPTGCSPLCPWLSESRACYSETFFYPFLLKTLSRICQRAGSHKHVKLFGSGK